MGRMKDIAIEINEAGWEPVPNMYGFYRNQEGQMATFTQIITNTVPKYKEQNPFGQQLP